MKKGIEWYKLLSDKEKMKFKNNCGNGFNGVIKDSFSSFRSFICCAFPWVGTSEGWSYWNDISKRQV